MCILRTWDEIAPSLPLLPSKRLSFVILWFSALFRGLPSDSSPSCLSEGGARSVFSQAGKTESISAPVLKAHRLEATRSLLWPWKCVFPVCPSPPAALTTHSSPRQGTLQASSALSSSKEFCLTVPACTCLRMRVEAPRSRLPAFEHRVLSDKYPRYENRSILSALVVSITQVSDTAGPKTTSFPSTSFGYNVDECVGARP